jgi:hypothetical protein
LWAEEVTCPPENGPPSGYDPGVVVRTTLDNYGQGRYAGVIVFNTDNRDAALTKVPGSRVYKLLPEGLYGGHHPRIWMAAQKALIEKDPGLVKRFLAAHILLTQQVKENTYELPKINREVFLQHFEEKGVVVADRHPLERFEERWQQARITYDPNLAYIRDLFRFLERKGLTRGMKRDEFAHLALLNEVLSEKGLAPIAPIH